MANTKSLIASTTVGVGGSANIIFDNIPQTYNNLMIIVCGRTTDTSGSNMVSDALIRFNSSSSGYSAFFIRNNTGTLNNFTSASYSYGLGMTNAGRNVTANTFSFSTMYIPNYNGNTNKSFFSSTALETDTANYDSANYIVAGLWANTAAITSIGISDGYAAFAQNSTISLYGIKNT
jgi:hypothetical protein